jgi:uncharacterized membrane protein YcaP (DUF421 family)
MLPAHLPVLGEIALRTAAIYMVVLLGVRLSGKREVGQMTPFDLTLLLLISNSVQNAMTGPDTSVTGGMAAAVTLLLMNYLVAELSGTNRRFRKIIQGEPTLLVHDGQLLPAHLSKEHISMDELERALREHGINTYHDLALAVLEVDGSISCLKYDELSPGAHNHLVRRKYRDQQSSQRPPRTPLQHRSLGHHDRQLIVGRDGDGEGLARGECVRLHRKRHYDRPRDFAHRVYLGFRRQEVQGMLLQFRDSLQISLSVDGWGSIVGLLAAAGIGSDLNSFDPNRLLFIVMY